MGHGYECLAPRLRGLTLNTVADKDIANSRENLQY
jgi:hypothetical protein